MALVHDTVSALGLFYALLAFSSIHRGGINQQAIQLKISALHFLASSVKDGALSSEEAIKHVATSMLLGAFEVSYRECIDQEKVSSRTYYCG
jgi:hypothetical protein